MYHPRFSGSHYEIGLKFGRKLKKQSIDFKKIIRLSESQKDFGKRSQIILKEYFPEICEEIHGMTDGLKFHYQTFTSWLLCMACCYNPNGCTAFCFIKEGQLIYGRNNDLPPFLKKVSMSILYKLDKGFSFIGNTSSMIHFEEGINNNSLVAAMTFVLPKIIEPGINSLFLVRYILEKCSNTGEAIDALYNIPIASACNILIADKKNRICIAECQPGKVIIRKPPKGESFVIAANHFVSDEARVDNIKFIYSSDLRYTTVYDALKNTSFTDSIKHAKDILKGKHGFTCQYKKDLNFETIWSSVIDITNKRIFRTEGSPLRAKYKEDKRLLQYSI